MTLLIQHKEPTIALYLTTQYISDMLRADGLERGERGDQYKGLLGDEEEE
jgi:hypothetical protein